jgi:tetratricopeptide (TPR) repeat protein
LTGLPTGEQHGYLAWMTARLHLNKGELSEAIQLAQQARDMGCELGKADIESMGILIHGIGLQASGDVKTGMALQDEAAASVLSGSVSPLVGGLIYCGIISSCCNCGDWQRAGQWTESFTRWCQRSHIDTFTGACLVHRAEIFAMSGRLEHARDAIRRADTFIRVGAPWVLGDAYRLAGDVHLARGEIEEAERCFQHAYQHGGDPYPGYAELLTLRGRGEEALRGLERIALQKHWVAGERRVTYLAHAARIAALLGQQEKARALLLELEKEWPELGSVAAAGQIDVARGELAWSENEMEEAQRLLQRALELFQRIGAVMDAARVRLRLAGMLSQLGDEIGARMELNAAEAVFQAAGAEGYLAECRALRDVLPTK